MRIKVDEDLPIAAVHLLRAHGHEAASVVEQGMGGFKDPPLWGAVQAGIRPILELLEQILAGYNLDDLSGAVAVATRRGIRIRQGSLA